MATALHNTDVLATGRREIEEWHASLPTRTDAEDMAVRRARVEEALRTAEDLVLRQQAEEAVSVLHEVLTQADEPRRRRIRLLLARAYVVDARWRRNAVALLRELVEQNPNDAEALAALVAKQTPSRTKRAARRSLMSRLFLVTR